MIKQIKNQLNKTFLQSLLIHFVLGIFFFALIKLDPKKVTETFKFLIVEKDAVVIRKKPNIEINASETKSTDKSSQNAPRKVLGVKRSTIVSEKGTLTAKIGNTVTKQDDKEILNDVESDSLPEPTEEFLITTMPRALKEIRPEYPSWAKEQKIFGSVIFEILIDTEGRVREAILLKGLHPELDKMAKEALLRFQFQPAFIEKEPAAVRIQYAIKYILES